MNGLLAARRPRAFRLAAVALSLAVVVGGAEAILAAAGLPAPTTFVDGGGGDAEIVDRRVYDVDPSLLWRPHRSATLDFPEAAFVRVHTNAHGLRGADRDDEAAKSRLRVLCMGDSITFGVSLADDETYPARLERALRDRLGPDVAPVVVNAGVPGYSSVQGMRLLDELASFKPDVVVWWFGMNDGKPAPGGPDSKLHVPDASSGGGVLSFFRRLRTIRFAESIGASLGGAATRVSPDEARETTAALAARAAAGGPTTLFVRCPSRLDEKLAQLTSIAAVVDRCGAARVEGAVDALSKYAPGPPGCEVVSKIDERPDGRVAVLGEGNFGRKTIDLDELIRRRDFVTKWKAAVDSYAAQLPPDALGYKDLFGAVPPSEVFSDNCHMTAGSARFAADAIATRIAEIVARRGGIRAR
jgi:lysophospholipase L1-like esterase